MQGNVMPNQEGLELHNIKARKPGNANCHKKLERALRKQGPPTPPP